MDIDIANMIGAISRPHQRHCYPPERQDDPAVPAYCGATRDHPTANTMEEIRNFGVCVLCHCKAMEDARRQERERVLAHIFSEHPDEGLWDLADALGVTEPEAEEESAWDSAWAAFGLFACIFALIILAAML